MAEQEQGRKGGRGGVQVRVVLFALFVHVFSLRLASGII